ncbi:MULTISPECIES: hypothetical protein [unclassified Streptomyces]|uniref:hypothetical protein n=1 Tax=unclassified Streptomyces TaxID=2593676 RepID=UPI0035D8BAAA
MSISKRNVPCRLMVDQNEVVRPRRFGENLLHQQRVDVDERGLRRVQGEHRGFG